MIIETKTYWCIPVDDESYAKPTDEDVTECVKIANEKNIRVWLHWFGPDNIYYGGNHSLFINPGMTVEEVKDKLPKIYAV